MPILKGIDVERENRSLDILMELDIKQLLSKGEDIHLECKKAASSLPGSIWATYSAFANTDGGTILLGIEEVADKGEEDGQFRVTGVEDADKIRKDFWNTINSPEKVNVNLLVDEDVRTEDVDGKKIVAIHVPRADYMLRPIYINGNLSKGTYRRNHEGDYHCTEQELRMMVRDANESGNDGMLLEYYTMDDVDIDTLKRFRQVFQNLHPNHPWESLDDKEFLMKFGGYGKDRKTGKEWLTMAGLLMFGKGLPVRERFDNLRMDYIDRSDLIGDQRYSDRLTYDGTWENNLFNFVRMVVPKLTRVLPHPFKMEGIIRTDDTLQDKAVREAFTNMIIHSDFMINGVMKVEKYDDRFVFTNPGLLKIPLEQIYHGGESKARNQRMQNMFRMIGYGENLGSGFPLILNAWNERHWMKPELVEQVQLLQVKLILHIQNEPINELINEQINERQKTILITMVQFPQLTLKEMSQKIDIPLRTLQREVDHLRECGHIKRDGSKKNGKWVVITPIHLVNG